ncbi:hypothetical protein ABPG72_016643 [Tetrahymena utriculariae]
MSSQTAQPSVQNIALAGSSASSIKLVQQQVQGFIQGLNNEELTKLLEIFEKSLSSPSFITKSCKMVQYKCYESKIDLNGKVGCGFGRSEEDAIAISIKDFFEIILQEEKYLYQVKECFRQMKGQTQSAAQQIQNSQPVVQSLSQVNASDKTQSHNKIIFLKVESETDSPTERKIPNQVIQDIDESESHPSDNNQDYQMVDNQISLIEMQINESNVYELSKKIGNISVINGPNVIASTNFNNNSQQDIDEMLLKIMFEEEKKFQQQNPQHSQLHSHQQSSNINQINFNQYLNSLQNSQSNQPLTQFQIYQMQYLQQQQQQQQFQLQNKNQGSQLQLQQIQQYFQSQQNSQGSYFQSALNNQQVTHSNTNIINSNHMKNNDINSIEQQQQQPKQQEELSPQSFENVSTPPNKNKRSSLSINNRAQQSQVNQQLNDTAFMPTKNVNTSSNTSNSQNNQQKLLRNNSIQNNNNHSTSQQENQGSHFTSQQSGSSLAQNNIQSSNNYNLNTQNSISLYANKENSFQNQNNINLVNSNSNNLSNTQSNFGLANKPTNQIASQSNNFNQTAQMNHQNSKTNLHLHSTHSTCCNHKEELEREHNKVENLEKKIKLLMEENKILKSLLLDNQTATTSQTIKNKLNSNQTPRGQLITQNNTTNTNQNNNFQEQTDFKNVNNNNNSQNFSNSKIVSRMSQVNMRSQSQDPTSKYLNNKNNQIITHTQYSSGQKKANFNTSDSKNNYLYGSSGKYANDDLNTSHISLNNSSQLNHSSMKKNVPKLNLEVLPNYHGNFNKSQNNKLLQEYNQKCMYKKRL